MLLLGNWLWNNIIECLTKENIIFILIKENRLEWQFSYADNMNLSYIMTFKHIKNQKNYRDTLVFFYIFSYQYPQFG